MSIGLLSQLAYKLGGLAVPPFFPLANLHRDKLRSKAHT